MTCPFDNPASCPWVDPIRATCVLDEGHAGGHEPADGRYLRGLEPVRQIAYRVPMTPQMLDDYRVMQRAYFEPLDRAIRPWAYPDPSPMPALVLLPELERALAGVGRARAAVAGARARLAFAARVLMHGAPDGDGDGDGDY